VKLNWPLVGLVVVALAFMTVLLAARRLVIPATPTPLAAAGDSAGDSGGGADGGGGAADTGTTGTGGAAAAPDPAQGRALISSFGCGSCHTVPGVRGAVGKVGPVLEHLRDRAYVAGKLPNTLDNLAFWIMHPQRVDPGNAMPDLNVNDKAARDMAAYLLGLR
jgi:cytochrome c1